MIERQEKAQVCDDEKRQFVLILALKKKKNENCTILIPKGNSYCRRKSSARGPWFKVSSEGLSAEIDIPQRSPIQVQTKVEVA